MQYLQEYRQVEPYLTKDGSVIRELMHPAIHGNRAQSLAEARVAPGRATALHRHGSSEEIYFVLSGSAWMTLGTERFQVHAGDTVCIPPGTAHCVETVGDQELRLLCSCAPAYRHEDTELVEPGAQPSDRPGEPAGR